jgi:isocitrate/isopropylmalate dehydrogenase
MFKTLLLPGDAIGPEITAATRVALEALDRRLDLGLELTEHPVGHAARDAMGSTFPASVERDARNADAVVLGPVSSYDYPDDPNPSAEIRRRLDLFANIRPAFTHDAIHAPAGPMDLVIVRENTEGFYADRNMALGNGEFMPDADMALSIRKITRRASERIAKVAFDLAMTRRKHVTMVHKANVLRISDGLFRDCVKSVANGYPEVTSEERIVDAMAALLIRDPAQFDVVVTTNMFGDILSDEAAELAGGLGIAGSVNVGENIAVAQAIHGSAPDIAGRDIANPVALMRSCVMLFDWMASARGLNRMAQAAATLREAVEDSMTNAQTRTVDLGGSASTTEVGQFVARRILERP